LLCIIRFDLLTEPLMIQCILSELSMYCDNQSLSVYSTVTTNHQCL
jgi:hypothetical protein